MTSEAGTDLIRTHYFGVEENFLFYDIPPKSASFYDFLKGQIKNGL